MNQPSAIILFSGGLDSTVALAVAKDRGRKCFCISFDYRQKHLVELKAAENICGHYGVHQKIIKIDPNCFSGSSLVDETVNVPVGRSQGEILSSGIQNTYVPARNTLFLSYALGYAEVVGACEIYVGFNKMDRGGYPDCRPEFVRAFQGVVDVATKQSAEGTPPQLLTPLIDLDKREIVELGVKLRAPIELTHSCYSPTSDGRPCHQCDACILREEAFESLR